MKFDKGIPGDNGKPGGRWPNYNKTFRWYRLHRVLLSTMSTGVLVLNELPERERDMVVRSRWRQTRQLGGKSRAFQSHRLALSNSGATIVEWCHGEAEAATRNVRGGWQLNISESGKYIRQLVWTGSKMRWSLRITQRYHISCCSWGHSDFMCRPSGSFQQLLLSVVVLHTEKFSGGIKYRGKHIYTIVPLWQFSLSILTWNSMPCRQAADWCVSTSW